MQSEASSMYLLKAVLTNFEAIWVERKVSSSIQASTLKNLGFDLLTVADIDDTNLGNALLLFKNLPN